MADSIITKQELIDGASLRSIEKFMTSNPDVHVATNRDEIILADGELAYLEKTMQNRITVYPKGGHCGNINYTVNANDMIAFLKGGYAQ